MNWTKYLWDVNLIRNPKPVFYMIDLTTRCNLKCKWCSQSEILKEPRNASTENVLNLIHEAIVNDKGVLFTGGGEPTLHPDFEMIMKKAVPAIGVGLVSNGTMPHKIRSYLNLFEKHDNYWVRLSLNDRALTSDLLELFKQYPKKIGVSIVVENLNKTYPAESLKDVAKFIRKKKAMDIYLPHPTMKPENCIGRRFHKLYLADGSLAYCCHSRDQKGLPPKFCPNECAMADWRLEDALKENPWT